MSVVARLDANAVGICFKRRVQTVPVPWMVIAMAPVVFAVATWSDRGQDYLPLAYTRLFGLPIVAVELCILLISIRRGWKPFTSFQQLSPITRALLGLLVVTALASAAIFAPRPVQALWWTYLSIIHFLFGFAVSSLLARCTSSERATLWPAVVAGLCAFNLLLLAFVNLPHSQGFNWEYLGFAVTNVRGLGFYSAVGAASAYALAVQRTGLPRWLNFAASALSVGVACWSGSRGALLAIILAIAIAMVLMSSFRTVRAAALALGMFAIGGAASLLQPSPFHLYGIGRIAGTFQSDSLAAASSGRSTMWTGAWAAFLRSPFLGYGEGQFGWVTPQPQGIYFHPHDAVLQLLVQWGVIGTALTLVLAAIAVRRSRLFNLEERPEAVPAFVTAAALLVFSLYDGALFHAYPVMMLSIALAALLTPESSGSGGASQQPDDSA